MHLKNKDGMFNVIAKFSYLWKTSPAIKILTNVCIPYMNKLFHEIFLKDFFKKFNIHKNWPSLTKY